MNRSLPIVLLLLIATISGCGTTGQVIKPNGSGYLETGNGGQVAKAQTVVADKVDWQDFKALALVTGSDFIIQQVRNLGYFGQVIDLPELQRRIVEKNLQDRVPSLSDRIGINNAARSYGRFIWVHIEIAKRDNNSYARIVATDPMTLKDIFVAEQMFWPRVYGGYDQAVWYPLFNSFTDWLKS